MAVDFSETLIVGISSSALFDLSEASGRFEKKNQENAETAVREYRSYMLEHEDEPLHDGTGMPLVKALLGLNKFQQEHDRAPIVEVVVISKNSPETGIRVLKQIRERKLSITRFAFTAGEPSSDYLAAFGVDLFLTTHERDAQVVADSKLCAGAVVKEPPRTNHALSSDQVRIAFDADAVLVSEDSEIINTDCGLPTFLKTEDLQKEVPLPEGPHAKFLKKLYKIQERLPVQIDSSPVRLAIMTARNSPAEMRLIYTMRSWGVYVDQAFFLGGLQKSKFLEAYKPHIFFDDQDVNLDPAALKVPSAKVLYPSYSPLNKKKKVGKEVDCKKIENNRQ